MHFKHTAWRLLITQPASGAWNMAVDEAILEGQHRENSLPTLRLYAWNPACLSLGYAQPLGDVDLAALAQMGWDLVRRPTGGRAILHTDELTYSVIGPSNEPRLAGSVLASYQVLSEALLAALHNLRVPAEAQGKPLLASESDPIGPVCFEVPSNYEITVGGKKLVGSAQARRKQGVLQHGSLPLCGDLGRITQALVFQNEALRKQAAERIWQRATTVERSLGRSISWDQAAQAFQTAFAHTLNLDLQPGELSADEQERANQLVEEKYAHPSWNERI
jgi:lipoyl(octanoyl) transferase